MPMTNAKDLNGTLKVMQPVRGWGSWVRDRTPPITYKKLRGRSNRRDPRKVGAYEVGETRDARSITPWNVERNLPKSGGRWMQRGILTRKFGADHRRIYKWDVPYQQLKYRLDTPAIWTTRTNVHTPDLMDMAVPQYSSKYPQPMWEQGEELLELYGMEGLTEIIGSVSGVIKDFINTGDLNTEKLVSAGIDYAATQYAARLAEKAAGEGISEAEKALLQLEMQRRQQQIAQAAAPKVPSWLLPVGLGVGALVIFTSMKK
jgi:hypothetical protein